MFRSKLVLICLVILATGGCGATTAPLISLDTQEPIQISASDDWPEDAVSEQLANARDRFTECGISLTFLSSDDLPATRLARFVQSLEPVDGHPIEGRAFAFSSPQVVEIAWAEPDGSPLTHKQILAHELGHLFGLRHTPLHSINLMAPHGCELCRFTQTQCRTIAENAKIPF